TNRIRQVGASGPVTVHRKVALLGCPWKIVSVYVWPSSRDSNAVTESTPDQSLELQARSYAWPTCADHPSWGRTAAIVGGVKSILTGPTDELNAEERPCESSA